MKKKAMEAKWKSFVELLKYQNLTVDFWEFQAVLMGTDEYGDRKVIAYLNDDGTFDWEVRE
jgi:hypothetical protein